MEIEKDGIVYVSAPENRPNHCNGCAFESGSENVGNCIGITRCQYENPLQIFVIKSGPLREKSYTITEIKRILLGDDWDFGTVEMICESITNDPEYAEFLRLSENSRKNQNENYRTKTRYLR